MNMTLKDVLQEMVLLQESTTIVMFIVEIEEVQVPYLPECYLNYLHFAEQDGHLTFTEINFTSESPYDCRPGVFAPIFEKYEGATMVTVMVTLTDKGKKWLQTTGE